VVGFPEKNVSGNWCLLCGKAGGKEHLDGTKDKKKLSDVDWHLDAWNYDFIDWLRTDPTTVGPLSTSISSTSASSGVCTKPSDLDMKDDGSFVWQDLGILKILPKEPYWIVFRKESGENSCLLCGKVADTWGTHTGSGTHVKRVASADYWMDYLDLGFLRPGGCGSAAVSKGSAGSAGASSSSHQAPTHSDATPPKTMVPWSGKSLYPKEAAMAKERGEKELIHRLAMGAARIQRRRERPKRGLEGPLLLDVWLPCQRGSLDLTKTHGQVDNGCLPCVGEGLWGSSAVAAQ
jgi:hypothetical protein